MSTEPQEKVTGKDQPPSYISPPPLEVTWDFRCLESLRARQEGSSIAVELGQFLPGKFGGGKINFAMISNPAVVRESWWEASVDVSVKSLPKSMREGWSWSEDNIDRAGGQLIIKSTDLNQVIQQAGWRCGRRYKLVDRAEDPQWEAVVWIYAKDLQSLSCVKLEQLPHEKATATWATNENNRLAYVFHRKSTHLNFNAIYDEMPLTGWWPWPRADGSRL
ncbi:unnamed protein product [Clonostachys byssicola]|uniref:Uncharacterized protein n=1 Tax=Clonostachys byssicola TaxID=160290 RepID=A0A9N9U2Q0_9HYPO|nr:unnamed protein product [Clonostachys byssicola]